VTKLAVACQPANSVSPSRLGWLLEPETRREAGTENTWDVRERFLEKLDQASRLRNLYPVLLFLRQDRLIRASPLGGSMARSMRQDVSEYTPPPFYAPPSSTTLWLWAWHAFASYCTPYFTSSCKHRQRTYVHTALPMLRITPNRLIWSAGELEESSTMSARI
jgi:hypothetical protein